MANDLSLGLRIRVNDDGTVQVLNRTSQGLRDISTSANQASRAVDESRRSFAQTALSALSIGDAARAAAAGFSAMALVAGAKELVQLADKMTLLDSRIKIATSSAADYVNSSKELVAISLRTGTSFEANATIFSRMNKALEGMGGSIRHTTALTETLAQTMRISGASTEEAASTVRQMSQALASGLLRGDEFNSIMENAPRLAQALADGMHVSIGALRAMAEAGELNSKRVIEAIQSQGKTIDDEFKHIPLTVGTAMTNVSTAFGQYVMEANKGSGATAGLAQNMNAVANNLTPIVNSIITLGKVSATVFVGQMVGNLAQFAIAQTQAWSQQRQATIVNQAHTEALVMNAEAHLAATRATTADLMVSAEAIAANRTAATTLLAVTNAKIAAARETLAQSATTVEAMHIQWQATQQLAAAEQKRVAILAELALLGRQQTSMHYDLGRASMEHRDAQRALATAQGEVGVAAASLTTQLRGMISVMGLLNIAMGVFVAFEVKGYFEELFTGSDFAARSMGALATWIEEVSRRGALLKAVFTSDTWDEVNAASERTKQTYINTTNELLRNNAAARNSVEISGAMKAALEEMKSTQQVYNEKIKEANEAHKAELINEEQRIFLGKKALETWEKANAAEAGAKKTDAGKEIVKLQDQYDKLTLSTEDYNKKHAEGIAGTAAEVAEVTRLSNAIAATEESKKSLGETSKKLANDEKSLQTAYDNAVNSMEQSLAKTGDHAKTAAMEYQVTKGELKGLNEAQKLRLLQLAAESEYQDKVNKSDSAAKSGMDALIDQYNKLTLSARDYYAATLKKDGISPEKAAPLMQQFDKNTAVEMQQKSIESARDAMQQYDDLIKQVNTSTSQLGATNSAVFDGALGGINVLVGAFKDMGAALKETTSQQELLNSAYAKEKNNINNSKLDDRQKYTLMLGKEADYLQANKKLENDKTIEALSGIRQMAGASASMFSENSKSRKMMHALEMAFGAVEMAMNIKSLAAKGAAAVLNQGTGDPYSAFARIAAMTAVVGGIIAMAGGAFTGGGSGGGSAPPVTSPTTGTVLGDSAAQSDSVNKTYELLKSIHAEEYAELRGINKGVNGMSAGVSNVITRLAQSGGISTQGINLSPTNSGSTEMGLALSIGTSVVSGIAATGILGSAAATIATSGISMALSAIGATGTAAAIASGGATFGVMASGAALMSGLATAGIGAVLAGIVYGVGKLLGIGKTKYSILGAGISTMPTNMADLMSDGGSIPANQYTTVEAKTKGWFSDSKRVYEVNSALSPDTHKAIDSLFTNIGVAMLSVSDTLGKEIGADLGARVKAYIIPAMRIELNGLSAEDQTKKLNSVVSTVLDNMSSTVFGDILGQYQQMGEGMLETAVRIVGEIAVVKDALSKSGLSLASNAIAIADAIAQAAGGLEEFQKQFSTYFDKFYSDTEKQADLQKRLATVLDGSLANSRDGYRKQIEALDLSNAKDQERYSLLIKMAGAADQYYTALEKANEAQDALLKQLSANVDSARSALTSAYKNEASALTATINKFDGFAASLRKFRDSLSIGDLSTGSPMDKYRAAGTQFNAVLAAINAGPGTTDASKAAYDQAQADFQGKASAFLSASRDVNASGSAYAADYQRVLTAIDKGVGSATAAKSSAQLQLDQLNASVNLLITINESVLSVREAIVLLNKNIDVQNATRAAITAKGTLDTATETWTNSNAHLTALNSTATSDKQAYDAAVSNVNRLQSLGAIPTTYQAGQTNNPIWEKVLAQFNVQHTAQFNRPMNREWTADSDAITAKAGLDTAYRTALSQALFDANAAVSALDVTAQTSAVAAKSFAAQVTTDKTAMDSAQKTYDSAQALVAKLTSALLDKPASTVLDSGATVVDATAQTANKTAKSPAVATAKNVITLSLADDTENVNVVTRLIRQIEPLKAPVTLAFAKKPMSKNQVGVIDDMAAQVSSIPNVISLSFAQKALGKKETGTIADMTAQVSSIPNVISLSFAQKALGKNEAGTIADMTAQVSSIPNVISLSFAQKALAKKDVNVIATMTAQVNAIPDVVTLSFAAAEKHNTSIIEHLIDQVNSIPRVVPITMTYTSVYETVGPQIPAVNLPMGPMPLTDVIGPQLPTVNMPLFARGGISNQPSIFGEAGPEAAVPLPDGRSIPVTISQPAGRSDNADIVKELKDTIIEQQKQNALLRQSLAVLQAGFSQLVAHSEEQQQTLESVERQLRRNAA